MKGLLLLFAFYLFALAIVPCHDAGECSEVRKEIAAHDHEGEDEQCPPFCVCACCGTVMAAPHAPVGFAGVTVTPDYPEHTYGYVSPAPDSLSTGIWQPPRMV